MHSSRNVTSNVRVTSSCRKKWEWLYVCHWRFYTRGRTNRLRRTNRLMCKRNEQIFRQTNRLIFDRLERRFFQDDLPIETNKSMTVRHKFTSDGQICSSSSVKTAMLFQSSVTLLVATNPHPQSINQSVSQSINPTPFLISFVLFFPLAIVHAVSQQTELLEQIRNQFVLSQNDESVSNHSFPGFIFFPAPRSEPDHSGTVLTILNVRHCQCFGEKKTKWC